MTPAPRLDRLAGAVHARGLDQLVVTGPANVRWTCGFDGSNGAAVVGAPDDGTRRFVTDFRYLTQAAEQVEASFVREIATNLLDAVAAGLPGDRPLRVGFDDEHLSVAAHAKLAERVSQWVELLPASGAVEDLRAIKDPDEVGRIRAAAALADDALRSVLGLGLVGRTEREVGLDLEIAMRRAGAQAASFPPIVAAGAHAALPHATPRNVPIPAGTLVVIDWGAQLDGYASDCTRTFATGELDGRDREIYALVEHAQAEALAAVRPGPTGREVDAVARQLIEAAGHGEHFGHGLGHGVGLEVHEGPRLSKLGEVALQAGHVVTVEPGVYVPEAVGVRIEDLVVVTSDGHDVLSTIAKTLTVVG